MRILSRIAIVAVMALFVAAALTPAQAACGAPYQVATIDANGVRSFVWNAGVFTPNYYNGYVDYAPAMYNPGNPPFTPALEGVWWALGSGNPALGSGDDMGAWTIEASPPLPGKDQGGWLSWYTLPAYAFYESAQIFTTWAAAAVIDGCLTNSTADPLCTCVLLTDQDGTDGYYAVASNSTDPNINTFLTQPGTDGNGNAGSITLQPIPKPVVTGSMWDPASGNIEVTVTASGNPGAYILDPACTCGPNGYQVVYYLTTRGGPPPDTRDIAAWTAIGAPAVAVGDPVTVNVDCGGTDSDLYLAAQLLFDSGFDAQVVSSDSTRIECGPTIADPSPRRQRMNPNTPAEIRPRTRTSR